MTSETASANVGRFARSVETGWVGKIVAVEDHGEPMYRMIGVDDLTLVVGGGTLESNLSPDDVQWFAPDDVRLLSPAAK